MSSDDMILSHRIDWETKEAGDNQVVDSQSGLKLSEIV